MNTFKTPKGTELPFLNLKGKDYLQVAHRIVWMREEKPDWTIETTIHTLTPEVAVVMCEISDPTGKVLSKAHKMQTAKGFPGGFLEKAESGAVGRALAFLGYGTAHAQELEDEDPQDLSTFSDTPLEPKNKQPLVASSKESTMPFGPSKGKTLKSLALRDLEGALKWAQDNKKFTEFQIEAQSEIESRKTKLSTPKAPIPHALEDIPF